MTALVVFDSRYGNTEKIAEAIGSGVGEGAPVSPIEGVDAATLGDFGLLIVGSPTQGGRPTAALQSWLARIPAGRLAGVRVASFDTRMPAREQGFALRTLMGVIGWAAPRILKALLARGGIAAAEAEGFIVEGREGPLRNGELERATRWGATLAGAGDRADAQRHDPAETREP